ncbi:MAG: TIGR00159 family protein [Ruminococcaceae bacterium]|nr:TIGR00159 family protein [Oscillospiraceae bacterium]
MVSKLKTIWDEIVETITSVEFSPINDIVDILLVTAIIYLAFKFLRDRRAGKLVVGVILFFILLLISNALELRALSFLLQSITQAGLVALIILFQPEFRSALEKVGTGSIKNIKGMFTGAGMKEVVVGIQELRKATENLSATKTGALMVIECETKLGDVIKSGTVIDADISSMLIGNIFYNKAPLHDGAMLIRNNRLYAAGCFLPLSQDPDIMKELGTRHRAAIGITEVSDAVVIIVSEETGIISVARDGNLERGLSGAALEKLLLDLLLTENGPKFGRHNKEDKDA